MARIHPADQLQSISAYDVTLIKSKRGI
jgi:hypothetical protein